VIIHKNGRCIEISQAEDTAWSRAKEAFNEWREFEINEYAPQTAYFSQDEARTLTRTAYAKWLREMEEMHLPDRLRKSERFSTSLAEFRDAIGATDYGASTVEIVEGLMKASSQSTESIAAVLDAASQLRHAFVEENQGESKEWYMAIVDREEELRRLITIISEGLSKVDELVGLREDH